MKLSFAQISLFGLSLLAGSLVVSSSLFATQDAISAPRPRYLQVRQVNGTVTSRGRPLKVGDRLLEASDISTSLRSSAVLFVDDGIGTVNVSPNTKLQVRSLKTATDGSKTTRLYMTQGQTRSKVRRFTNRRSRYEIETPGGIAGTRGTEFGVTVSLDGKTGLSTIQGVVAFTAGDKTVLVEPGYSSLIVPGEVPMSPKFTTSDTRVRLQVLPADDGVQVRVLGFVDPANLVLVNDRPIDTGGYGQLDAIVPLPPDRLITLVVRTPLGNEQIYELDVPKLAGTDGNSPSP